MFRNDWRNTGKSFAVLRCRRGFRKKSYNFGAFLVHVNIVGEILFCCCKEVAEIHCEVRVFVAGDSHAIGMMQGDEFIKFSFEERLAKCEKFPLLLEVIVVSEA